jgi:hypothetical protein
MASKLLMERADSKFEARNSKFGTNPNVPNSNVFSLFAGFELLNFEFVSDFDIRISDFWRLKPVWFRLCRVRMKAQSGVQPCSPLDAGRPVFQVHRGLQAGQLIKAGLTEGKIHDLVVDLDLQAQALFVEHFPAIGAAGIILERLLTQGKLHHQNVLLRKKVSNFVSI